MLDTFELYYMSSIIKLLPDVVVNQIAAGEVIQRPASVVKELMDNALDSGSNEISVKVSQAGKEMILIQDNGCGMSPTDARMAFERHATSKIKNSEDLFRIQTLGFRGEALASIAAVSRVELKTKQAQDEVGTRILIQDSKVVKQEACACLNGTQIQVSDLFYTVPARKKFLKTDASELRYIQEEFISQALSHPEVKMSFIQNEAELYLCRPEGLKQRIQSIFGKKYPENLIEINQDTEVVSILGFIGNRELVRKSKGDQYLYINRRLVKSNYLNHAINSAYEEVLAIEGYPFYVIFLNIDPNNIDINVHPTKHEIKINDERLVYNFIKVAIKQVLGRQLLAPQLDFENAVPGIDKIFSPKSTETGFQSSRQFNYPPNSGSATHWKNLAFPTSSRAEVNHREENIFKTEPENLIIQNKETLFEKNQSYQVQQIYSSYIIFPEEENLTIIDQQNAHERILYEFYLGHNHAQIESRNLLFPITLHVNKSDAISLKSIQKELLEAGLLIEEFGSDTFIIQSVPSLLDPNSDLQKFVEDLISQYKFNLNLKLDINENLARSMARSGAIKRGKEMAIEEMQTLINQLFQCQYPEITPSGKKIIYHIPIDQLTKFFK